MPFIIQQTGLSGAGKSTLASITALQLTGKGYQVVVIDGDEFRKTVSSDLGFSKNDRLENIRRMGKVASETVADVVIISAINPYKEGRAWLKSTYHAHLHWIDCDIKNLIVRDPKNYYKKALLPDGHLEKMYNLTGLGGDFDEPLNPELIIKTDESSVQDCVEIIVKYILQQLTE
jgi:adenylylsulfate kinase